MDQSDLPVIPDRVDFWAIQWARWVRQYRPDLGYPHRAVGLKSGGESRRGSDVQQDFDDEIWGTNCRALDALIDSLSPAKCCAVRSVYLGEPWRFPRDNKLQLLGLAAHELIIGMDKRGVCL